MAVLSFKPPNFGGFSPNWGRRSMRNEHIWGFSRIAAILAENRARLRAQCVRLPERRKLKLITTWI
jgi:hypothetical protein